MKHIDGGVRDQIENYSCMFVILSVHNADIYADHDAAVNRDVAKRQHPKALRPFIPELDKLARHSHEEVLHPILR